MNFAAYYALRTYSVGTALPLHLEKDKGSLHRGISVAPPDSLINLTCMDHLNMLCALWIPVGFGQSGSPNRKLEKGGENEVRAFHLSPPSLQGHLSWLCPFTEG